MPGWVLCGSFVDNIFTRESALANLGLSAIACGPSVLLGPGQDAMNVVCGVLVTSHPPARPVVLTSRLCAAGQSCAVTV